MRPAHVTLSIIALFAFLAGASSLAHGGPVPTPPIVTPPAQELRWGQEVVDDQRAHHHIVTNDPADAKRLAEVTDVLRPVADAWYHGHFEFYLIDNDPYNAYAQYGPYVYVDKTLVAEAPNREELAAVLCHEMSHAIHHDAYLDAVKTDYDSFQKRLQRKIEMVLRGKGKKEVSAATGLFANLLYDRHSRFEETLADLNGTDLCAESGINPWGMIWVFKRYEGGGLHVHIPTMFGDHPDFPKRISDVKKHFHDSPELFAHWSPDLKPTPF